MSQSQTAINAKATRWLADILERRGVANPHELAEHVTTELLAQGLAPVPRPFPLRSTAPAASPASIQAAKDAAAEAVAAAKAKRTRVGPPPTPSVEDLVAGAALLGLNQDDVATAIEQLDLAGPTADDQPPVGYRCDPLDQHADCTLDTCQCECHDDDVVEAVIHEADCPGGDCQCDDDAPLAEWERDLVAPDFNPEAYTAEHLPEPAAPDDDQDHEPSTWGPDDPPF